jgi:Domain of unknown function (DUF4129)
VNRVDARTARLFVGFAAVLGVLLALVALASGGSSAAQDRGDGPLAPGAATWLYAVFVVVGLLAVPLFVYVYTREVPHSAERRRRARLMPLVLVALALALLVLAVRSPDGFGEVVRRLRLDRDPRDGMDATVRRPPSLELFPFMVVSSAVLAGAAAIAAHRLLRRPASARATLPEELSQALDESLDDLRAEPDARVAVVRAYARMEATLERFGVPRHEAMAPFEYVGRVLLELDVRPEPVHRLAELFERARFSRHVIGPDLKEGAIDALESIRDDLRGAGE